ncbi:MAG: hypothetical protein R3300_14120 [Candidatus Promineifilaceae bacterium]|nr:hypothetical protein [Candidatus Promineifilaceae bacterium]
MAARPATGSTIPTTRWRLRRWVARPAGWLMPGRLDDPHRALAQSEGLNAQGYGIVLLINHFSTRDSLQALQLLFASPVFSRRPILAPVAFHQYGRYGALIRFLARRLGLQLCPIVTGGTVKRLGASYQRGQGLPAYLQAAAGCLAQGGIILLAPQGGRRRRLGRPRGRPVGNLLAYAKRHGVSDVALLLLGLGLSEAEDYDDPSLRGYNLGRVYDLHLGQLITLQQLTQQGLRLRQIDAWVFERLAELVPTAYMRPVSV